MPKATSRGSAVAPSAPGRLNSEKVPLGSPRRRHCPVPMNPILPACFSAKTIKLLFLAAAIANGDLAPRPSVGRVFSIIIVATVLSGVNAAIRNVNDMTRRSRLSVRFPVVRLEIRPDSIKAANKAILNPRRYQIGSKRITEVRVFLPKPI